MWIRDTLPIHFPRARILTFGYDAGTHRLSKPTARLGLSEYAEQLVQQLLRNREDDVEKVRPILC